MPLIAWPPCAGTMDARRPDQKIFILHLRRAKRGNAQARSCTAATPGTQAAAEPEKSHEGDLTLIANLTNQVMVGVFGTAANAASHLATVRWKNKYPSPWPENIHVCNENSSSTLRAQASGTHQPEAAPLQHQTHKRRQNLRSHANC